MKKIKAVLFVLLQMSVCVLLEWILCGTFGKPFFWLFFVGFLLFVSLSIDFFNKRVFKRMWLSCLLVFAAVLVGLYLLYLLGAGEMIKIAAM